MALGSGLGRRSTPRLRGRVDPVLGALLLGVCLTILGGGVSRADWPTTGLPIGRPPALARLPLLAYDPARSLIVVWQENRVDPTDVYLQRVLPTGAFAPGFPPSGRALLTSPSEETPYRLLRAPGGAFYLEFSGHTAGMLYGAWIGAQRFFADGTPSPGWPTNGVQITDIASDGVFPDLVSSTADSGVFIPFALDRAYGPGGFNDTYNYAHRVQRLGPEGVPAPGWPDSGVHVCDAPYRRLPPFAVRDEHGGVFVIWTDLRYGNASRPHATHVLANAVMDPAYELDGRQLACAPEQVGRLFIEWTLSDEAGGFYMVATDYSADLYGDLRVFRFGPEGYPAPGWPVNGRAVEDVPQNVASLFNVREDGQGGLLLAMRIWVAGVPQVRIQRLAASGAPSIGWPEGGRVVNIVPPGLFGLATAHMAPDGRGGCWVVWEEVFKTFPLSRCVIQHLDANSQPAPGWVPGGVPVQSAFNSTSAQPHVTEDGASGAYIVWRETLGSVPPPPELYAQRYLPDGVVAAEISLVAATAEPGLARLEWYSAQSATLEARVYRREATSQWRELARVRPHGTGRLMYEDREVGAGGRYAYRLGLAGGTGETFSDEVWLEIPSAHRLALEGAWPNPASGSDLALGVMLADERPAHLELVDLGGRVVARRTLAGLAPGRHRVSLASERLAPGMYWARLTQGERDVRAKFVVVR